MPPVSDDSIDLGSARPDADRAADPAADRAGSVAADLLAGLYRQISLADQSSVEVVLGGPAVAALTYGAAAACRAEALSLEPRQSHGPLAERTIGDQIDLALAARGVRQWVVIAQSVASRSDAWVLEELARAGQPPRYNPAVPARMLVFDRRQLFLAVDPANTRAGAYTSQDPDIVASARRLFAVLWECGVPPPVSDPDDTPADQLGQLVLHALGDGLKDEAIARRLGVSTRTVRRAVARLQQQHGASSRFQLATMVDSSER